MNGNIYGIQIEKFILGQVTTAPSYQEKMASDINKIKQRIKDDLSPDEQLLYHNMHSMTW